jgi:uncharacterized protein YjbI with pentapeptide repeats
MDKKPPVVHRDHNRPIQPNMLMLNADARSSTIAKTVFSHSVFTEIAAFNSRFHESNFEGTSFDGCDFDGAVFSGCSFRGVEFANCDVDHLIINGINIGNLLRIMMGEVGGKK